MTLIVNIHCQNPEIRHIKAACMHLHKGDVLLVPTETGYCFMASCSHAGAHKSLLALRPGHPKNKPFSLMCPSLATVSHIAQMPTTVFRLATRLWPGPYTLILECNKNTPKMIEGPKRKTVGIRMSSHPIAQSLLSAYENPVLVTSVTDEDELAAEHYFEADDDDQSFWWATPERICDHISERYTQGGGLPIMPAMALESDTAVIMRVSTVIDCTVMPPVVIRDGGWPLNGLV